MIAAQVEFMMCPPPQIDVPTGLTSILLPRTSRVSSRLPPGEKEEWSKADE